MSAPCLGCGHAKRNHLQGEGLCVVKSCKLCLIYRPTPMRAANGHIQGCPFDINDVRYEDPNVTCICDKLVAP